MKIVFLTMTDIPDLECGYIYTELMKVFIKEGHEVTIVSPSEQGEKKYSVLEKEGYTLVKIKVLNGAGVNFLKKGLNTLFLEQWYIKAIKKYLKDKAFDLILYSTPPITLCKAVKYIKKRDNACTYLMLKDIFPQNAVDLGVLSATGIRGIIYRYFRKKEKELYRISDYIGCMSEANIQYLKEHNPEVPQEKLCLCVNSIIPSEKKEVDKEALKIKLGLPTDKKVFFYGGNLGKPQGIDFLLQVLKSNKNLADRYFVVCGKGTEYYKVQRFMETESPENIKLINGLPKQEYDEFLKACDIGMLFLDYRFTIPNFPSRLLPCLDYGIPVLAVTDSATDIGLKIREGKFGWSCHSADLESCNHRINEICELSDLEEYRLNARHYLEENYTADITYKQIMERIG